jgi:hypothetical protein
LPAGVYEITDAGAFVRQVIPLAGALGIATNPADGHLWVTTQVASGHIFDVNPLTGAAFDWSAAHGNPNNNFGDGLTFSPDGKTLYTAIGGVQGFNVATGALVFNSAPISGFPDGIALGAGSLAGLAFVNTNDGNFWEVSLNNPSPGPVLIATGGSRGDFVSPDPYNNSLLLSQSDRVFRLTAPPNGGFVGGPAAPAPATLAQLAAGAIALAGYGLGRRKSFRRVGGVDAGVTARGSTDGLEVQDHWRLPAELGAALEQAFAPGPAVEPDGGVEDRRAEIDQVVAAAG